MRPGPFEPAGDGARYEGLRCRWWWLLRRRQSEQPSATRRDRRELAALASRCHAAHAPTRRRTAGRPAPTWRGHGGQTGRVWHGMGTVVNRSNAASPALSRPGCTCPPPRPFNLARSVNSTLAWCRGPPGCSPSSRPEDPVRASQPLARLDPGTYVGAGITLCFVVGLAGRGERAWHLRSKRGRVRRPVSRWCQVAVLIGPSAHEK
jgi:hypothetical protein